MRWPVWILLCISAPVAFGQPFPWLGPRPLPPWRSPWYGYGYAYGYYEYYHYPQSIIVDSQVIPNPPLPPVNVDLFNGGRREIQVALIDRQAASASRSFRLRPGQKTTVRLQRDSGGRMVQTYRSVNYWGDVLQRRVVHAVAPTHRYEIVVHEWSMQSVAIDRTGKSPNVIEDINFQGRGLGRFQLPAGEQLISGMVDVYRGAATSGLAGTIAPILAEEKPTASTGSPLERAVLEAQRRAQQRAQRGR